MPWLLGSSSFPSVIGEASSSFSSKKSCFVIIRRLPHPLLLLSLDLSRDSLS